MEECDCDDCCGSRVGPQGFMGAQGSPTIGTQGPIGIQGAIVVGAQGEEGFQGPELSGIQGFSGAQGPPDGLPAVDGNIGERGYQGAIDGQGPQGFRGDVGLQGTNGSNQNTGPRGFQGPFVNGSQGNQGPIGSRTAGPQGPIGFMGLPWQSDKTENSAVTQYSAPTLTLPLSTIFSVPRPTFVRIVLHMRIDTPAVNFDFGIYNSSVTQIGPLFRMTSNAQQRQVLVIARNVPAGTYKVGFVASDVSALMTIFNFSAVALYQ